MNISNSIFIHYFETLSARKSFFFQGLTDDLFKINVMLVSGVGESMIHSFILVVY